MKTLLLVACAIWLSACGGSSGGTGPTVQQVQTTPSSTNQTPQQPSDSVPPVNSQQPPGNSQQAPANSQQPPLNSPLTQPAITCAQVAAALQTGGCHISDSAMSDCVAGTVANMPCGAEWQAVFACLLHGVTCNNDNRTVNVNDACPDQNDALGACLEGTVVPVPSCSAPRCDGCSSDCDTCVCQIANNPAQDCTQRCATN